MEQQDNFFKMDFIDLSTSWSNESTDQNQSSIVWKEEPKELRRSDEELKIRNELEIEIENDLEEEIKEGICDLALRLHWLYQHKKERIARELSTTKSVDSNRVFRGMHIVIRMDGGATVEVKEIKKVKKQPKISVIKDERDIDWVRSLRSLNKKLDKSRNSRAQRKSYVLNLDQESGKHERKKCSNIASRKMKDEEFKVREIGWQS